MVDWDKQRELLPHYIASLVLVFAGIALVEATIGDYGLVGNLAVVVVVVLTYPMLARWLGVAPSAWETDS